MTRPGQLCLDSGINFIDDPKFYDGEHVPGSYWWECDWYWVGGSVGEVTVTANDAPTTEESSCVESPSLFGAANDAMGGVGAGMKQEGGRFRLQFPYIGGRTQFFVPNTANATRRFKP